MANKTIMVIGYRATAEELAMLNAKVRASGLCRAEFLRKLVESAVVEPVSITFEGKNNHHDANDLTGQSVAVVA